MWAYKTQREIARRMSVYRGEVESMHPPFAPGSPAACGPSHPAPENSRIEYSAEDDKVLEAWIRKNVDTTWHSMGTCRMAPREKGGVVDDKLAVYGVKGLKVVDLSIAPGNVAANTAGTALGTGERAAAIFAGELGLELGG